MEFGRERFETVPHKSSEFEFQKNKILIFSLTFLYNDLRVVIPEKAGIQIENTGFPRIKYGAGLVKSGMTKCVKSFLRQYTRTLVLFVLLKSFSNSY